MSTMKGQQRQNIQVYVRARPINAQEQSRSSHSVMETTEHTVKMQERPTDRITKSFTYDRVFGPNSKQVDVYRVVVGPLIDQVLLGYNCTVFAYGQTGTGKTYTMEGRRSDDNLPWDQDPDMGIIPRTLSHLFDELRIQGVEFTVRVSFLEMYNEELFDLLGPEHDTTRLKLYEDSQRKGSCVIHGLEEVTVHTKQDVYEILRLGSQKRQTAATLMNAQSSRSHTVFSITVHIKESTLDGEELLKTGKINLVDLAGSENIGRSGAVDRRAREAGNINQSLLTLGRVITSLVERAPHVPYRESKLTRLLQDSLGGRTRTSLIAAVSPASCNVEETLSTLDYAQRARNIQNKPEVNQKLSKKTLMKEYTEEIERLRRDLMAQREQSGVYLAPENHAQLLNTIEQHAQELVDKVNHIRTLEGEIVKMEGLFSELNAQLADAESRVQASQHKLEDTQHTLARTKQCLVDTEMQRDEQAHLVEKRADTEHRLTGQASQLLSAVADVSADLTAVHDKLDRKRSLDSRNDAVAEQFRAQYHADMSRLQADLEAVFQQQGDFCQSMYANLGAAVERRKHETAALSGALAALLGSLNGQLRELEAHAQQAAGGAKDWLAAQLVAVAARRDQQESAAAGLLRRLLAAVEAARQWLQRIGAAETAAEAAQRELLLEHWTAAAEDDDQIVELLAAREQQLRTEHAERNARLETENERLNHELTDAKNELESHRSLLRDAAAAIRAVEKSAEKLSDLHSRHGETQAAAAAADRAALETSRRTAAAFHPEATRRVEQARSRRGETAARAEQLFVQREQEVAQQQEAAATELEASSSEVTASLAELNAGWQQHCQLQEQATRARYEAVNGAVQHTQQRVQAAAGSLHTGVRAADQLLEAQNGGFFSTIGDRQSELTEQCSRINQQAADATRALRSRENDVQVFVLETLQRDAPTGTTPQRRQFQYPRYLAATSPHDRILQRYRSARRRDARSNDALEDIPLPEFSADELLESPETPALADPAVAADRTASQQNSTSQTNSSSTDASDALKPTASDNETLARAVPAKSALAKAASEPQLKKAVSSESLQAAGSVSDVSDAGSDAENKMPQRRMDGEFALPTTRRHHRRGLRQPKTYTTRRTVRESPQKAALRRNHD